MARNNSNRFPPPLPDSKFVFQKDSDGSCSSALRKLIIHPDEEKRKRRENQNPHPYYRRPGKGHNHDNCDSCKEGGGPLICCDVCPSAFHTICHYPPISDTDEIPHGSWNCCKCVNKAKVDELKKEIMNKSNKTKKGAVTKPKVKARNQRALNRAARKKSVPAENAPDGGASAHINNAFDALVAKSLDSNPESFDLPETMVTRVKLPGMERIPMGGKSVPKRNTNPKKKLEGTKTGRSTRIVCAHCFKSAKIGPMMTCDFCSNAFHFDCLDPPLTTLPTNNWICPMHTATFIDENLWKGGYSERVKMYDKYVFQPVNEQRIKIDFLRSVHNYRYFPYKRNLSLPPANTIQIPDEVVEAYRTSVKIEPSSVEFEQAVTREMRRRWLISSHEVAPQLKPSREDYDLIVEMACKAQVIGAQYILTSEVSSEVNNEPEEETKEQKDEDEDFDLEEDNEVVDVYKPQARHITNGGLANGSQDTTTTAVIPRSYSSPMAAFNQSVFTDQVDQMIFGDINEQKKKYIQTEMEKLIDAVQEDIDALVTNGTEEEHQPQEVEEIPKKRQKQIKSKKRTSRYADGKSYQDIKSFKEIQYLQKMLSKMSPEGVNLLALNHLIHMKKSNEIQQKKLAKKLKNAQTNGYEAETKKPQETTKEPEGTTQEPEFVTKEPKGKTLQLRFQTEEPKGEIKKLKVDSESDFSDTSDEEDHKDPPSKIKTRSTTPHVIELEESVEVHSPRKVLGMPVIKEEPHISDVDIKPFDSEDNLFYGRLISASRFLRHGDSIDITKAVFSIGTDAGNDLCLNFYGDCRHVSETHGVILYDSVAHRLVYNNYSIFGTIVDSVLYGQDNHLAVSPPSKMQTQIEEIKNIRQQRKRVLGEPKNMATTSSNDSNVDDPNNNLSQGITTVDLQLKERWGCCCKALPKGPECCPDAPAYLQNGSVIRFGCIVFTFCYTKEKKPLLKELLSSHQSAPLQNPPNPAQPSTPQSPPIPARPPTPEQPIPPGGANNYVSSNEPEPGPSTSSGSSSGTSKPRHWRYVPPSIAKRYNDAVLAAESSAQSSIFDN